MLFFASPNSLYLFDDVSCYNNSYSLDGPAVRICFILRDFLVDHF